MKFGATCTAVAWNPTHLLLAVACDEHIYFLDPGLEKMTAGHSNIGSVASQGDQEKTVEEQEADGNVEGEPSTAAAAPKEVVTVESLLTLRELVVPQTEDGAETKSEGAKARAVKWAKVEEDSALYKAGARIKIQTDCDVQQLMWHVKGNYCAAVSPKAKAPSNAVIIHALHQQKSMRPFSKLKKGGNVQTCCFHPTKPHFFVATKTSVRVYDLQKQEPLRHLISGARWISSISMHPGGDNVVAGSYDRKIVWFDLDFASKPYKTLQYHDRAVRRVAFHQGRYPLLAAASDDGTVSILHAKVFSDLMQSPMIVPVKRLRDHLTNQGLGVLDLLWHPHQPWLITAGADGCVYLWA